MQVYENARLVQKAWAALSLKERLSYFKKLSKIMVENLESLTEEISKAQGKIPMEVLAAEILVALEFMRYYESHAEEVLEPRPLERTFFFAKQEFWVEQVPHGVVLIISPWNFPFQLSFLPTLSALLTGNAVVLKPSEFSTFVGPLMARLFEQAGFPKDVFQYEQGDAKTAQALIAAKPDFIFFTGSSATGKKILEQAAPHIIPVHLELGGKDPMIICADANLERAVQGAIYGAYTNAGQVCISVQRIFVEASLYDRFLSRFKEEAAKLRVGSSNDSEVGPILTPKQMETLQEQISRFEKQGARMELPLKKEGNFLYPLLLSGVDPKMDVYREECFGPLPFIHKFQSDDEAIAIANDTAYGLNGYVWSSDLERAKKIASQLKVGAVAINDVIRNVAHAPSPFGGVKQSGYGRYHGPEGLKTFTFAKSYMMSSGRSAKELGWFPYSQKQFSQLTKVIKAFYSRWNPLLWCLCLMSGLSNAATLKVRVENIKSTQGKLLMALFENAKGFPAEGRTAFAHKFLEIPETKVVESEFTDVPSGQWAISVLHDANNNEKLDTNFIGIPKEAVGTSMNPKPRMGPPRFSDAMFEVQHEDKSLTVKLVTPGFGD